MKLDTILTISNSFVKSIIFYNTAFNTEKTNEIYTKLGVSFEIFRNISIDLIHLHISILNVYPAVDSIEIIETITKMIPEAIERLNTLEKYKFDQDYMNENHINVVKCLRNSLNTLNDSFTKNDHICP